MPSARSSASIMRQNQYELVSLGCQSSSRTGPFAMVWCSTMASASTDPWPGYPGWSIRGSSSAPGGASDVAWLLGGAARGWVEVEDVSGPRPRYGRPAWSSRWRCIRDAPGAAIDDHGAGRGVVVELEALQPAPPRPGRGVPEERWGCTAPLFERVSFQFSCSQPATSRQASTFHASSTMRMRLTPSSRSTARRSQAAAQIIRMPGRSDS